MTAGAAMTNKDLLWLGCREKACCHNSRVIISGRDLWRLSRTLDLAPWLFTRYCEAVDRAPDGFLLEPAGPRYQIVLAKRGAIGSAGAPCIFLWKLADGHAQCGLGALRPSVCQSYPAYLSEGLLCTDSSACTCRRWSLVDLDPQQAAASVAQTLAEAEAYAQVVATWNEQAARAGRPYTYREFCAYLLDLYDQREGGRS